MSKQEVTIQFRNITQLWQFAQSIRCHSMEIIAAERILICPCSESDIAMLEEYEGHIIDAYHPFNEQNISKNKTFNHGTN